MKRILLCVIGFELLLFAGQFIPVPCRRVKPFDLLRHVYAWTPHPNLVAYWRFEGNANDASGRGHNGTDTSATLTIGKFGQAYIFGQDDYIWVDDDPHFTLTTGFTATAWVYLTAPPPSIWGTVVGQLRGISGAWCLGVTSGTPFVKIYTYGNTFAILTDNTTQLALNTWYHIAGVHLGGTTGTNGIIYVNGKEVFSGTLAQAPRDDTSKISIGNSSIVEIYGMFNGKIDEPRVYNRGLTAAEIKADMLGFVPGEF